MSDDLWMASGDSAFERLAKRRGYTTEFTEHTETKEFLLLFIYRPKLCVLCVLCGEKGFQQKEKEGYTTESTEHTEKCQFCVVNSSSDTL